MPRDYYLVLARAISALDPNTADARRAVYDRARLTVMDAGLPAAETDAERAALERAIGRIETEAKHAPVRPSPASDRPAKRSAAAPLLHNVRELVREQPPARVRSRLAAGREHDL